MAAGTRISALALWVRNPEQLAQFYCDVLGMSRQQNRDVIAVGYGGEGACLILHPSSQSTPYVPAKTDRYWKIAITLPDLDHAQAEIAAHGVSVTRPHQFRDIARMSHLADPEGHVIELIQHTFEGNPLSAAADPCQPLGGGAQIGLITLRTSDIDAEMQVCRQGLGMTYLSRQSVADLGFDLYFFAPTSQHPPSGDVNALENREWLWQRSYTVLEFQHLLDSPAIRPAQTDAPEVLVETTDGARAHLR